MLDISGVLWGSRPNDLADIPGYFVPMAQSIKSVVDVPVIAVGGITDAVFANSVMTRFNSRFASVRCTYIAVRLVSMSSSLQGSSTNDSRVYCCSFAGMLANASMFNEGGPIRMSVIPCCCR